MTAIDPMLQRAIDAIALPGILVDHRLIADGDELALLPEELVALGSSVLKVRRASGAARIVARKLLSRFGQSPCAIPRGAAGMPLWPHGLVGSLAHDSKVAIAAMAARRDFLSVGIDVEPAEPLNPDLLGMVATPRELERIADDPCGGRLLFSIKDRRFKDAWMESKAQFMKVDLSLIHI